VEEDNKTLHVYYNSNKEPLTEVNENEVLKYIFSFKNGKAPDDSKVTSEHLKYGGQKLITVLTMLVNFIFQNKHIPPILKSGIACPIYKKGGKPTDNPNSYRKITVTNPIGKLIEKLHLCRNTQNICETQSALQKGFIGGESPTIAALIVTELFTEAIENNNPFLLH
jgi:hypothetical protein